MHFTMILVGLAMLNLSPLLAAAPLKVPEDFSSIQEAIDAAKSGDVVLVAAGKYPGPLNLKPGIVVRSVGGDEKGKLGMARAEATIIDGGKKPNTGVLMAEGSMLDGFTVTNVGEYDDALWNKHHATRGNEQGHEHIGGFGSPGIGADGVNCTIKNNIAVIRKKQIRFISFYPIHIGKCQSTSCHLSDNLKCRTTYVVLKILYAFDLIQHFLYIILT